MTSMRSTSCWSSCRVTSQLLSTCINHGSILHYMRPISSCPQESGLVQLYDVTLFPKKKCAFHRCTREIQNLCHFYPGMGFKLGSSGFSPSQNNHGSSGAYVTCIYSSLSMKINMCKTPHKDCGRICFAFVVGKNPKTPNLSLMADDAITQDGIQGLGSPLYICAAF